jgi:hypothetical protein
VVVSFGTFCWRELLGAVCCAPSPSVENIIETQTANFINFVSRTSVFFDLSLINNPIAREGPLSLALNAASEEITR